MAGDVPERGLHIAKEWGFIFARTFSMVVLGLSEGTNPRAFSPTTCQWFPRSPVRRPGLFAFFRVPLPMFAAALSYVSAFVLLGFAIYESG